MNPPQRLCGPDAAPLHGLALMLSGHRHEAAPSSHPACNARKKYNCNNHSTRVYTKYMRFKPKSTLQKRKMNGFSFHRKVFARLWSTSYSAAQKRAAA
jgi:hypothetical protein